MSNKSVPHSPVPQAHIKQLQPTQPLAKLQPEPEKQEPETEHAQEQQEPDSEPEPSSEREPLAALPDNIENPVFGFCKNNACIICPFKTVKL